MSTLTSSKRLHHTEIGYHYLREAYDAFKDAGAIHTAARIKACLKSAEGAVRHALRLDALGEEDRAKLRKIRVHRRRPSKVTRKPRRKRTREGLTGKTLARLSNSDPS